MNLPNKSELKEKYKITNNDFQILTSPPSDEEIRKNKSFLVRVPELLGSPTWLWKSFAGTVLGVVIMASSVIGHYNNIKPITEYSINQVGYYLQEVDFENIYEGVIAFLPEDKEEENRPPKQKRDEYPLNTILAPPSGSFHV